MNKKVIFFLISIFIIISFSILAYQPAEVVIIGPRFHEQDYFVEELKLIAEEYIEKIIVNKTSGISVKSLTKTGWLNSLKTTRQINEQKYDPKTPEMVLFGLIFVNFFHLKILPKTYPPISELIEIVIAK